MPIRKIREVWAIPRWRSSPVDASAVNDRAPLEVVAEPKPEPIAEVVELPAPKTKGSTRPPRPKPGETVEECFARRAKNPHERVHIKEPEPGKRRCGCPIHQGKLVPIAEFAVKDKRRGTLASWYRAGRPLPTPEVTVARESPLWVEPAEIPAADDVARLGKALTAGSNGERMS